MKLEHLSLSIDNNSVSIPNLRRLNIFLGKANIGKTYILDSIYKEAKRLATKGYGKDHNRYLVYLKDMENSFKGFDYLFDENTLTSSLLTRILFSDYSYREKLENMVRLFFNEYETKDIANPLKDWTKMSNSFKKLIHLATISSSTTFEKEYKTDIVIVDDIDSGINFNQFDSLAKMLIESDGNQFFVVVKSIEMLKAIANELDNTNEEVISAYSVFRNKAGHIQTSLVDQKSFCFNISVGNEIRG